MYAEHKIHSMNVLMHKSNTLNDVVYKFCINYLPLLGKVISSEPIHHHLESGQILLVITLREPELKSCSVVLNLGSFTTVVGVCKQVVFTQ